MTIYTILHVKWSSLKRKKTFYLLILFNYFLLAMVDTKSFVLMSGVDDYIFRYVMQGVYIVIMIPLFVDIIFNEKTIDIIKNYMIIYVKDIRKEIYGTTLLCIIVNIVALFIGQMVVLSINYIYFGKVPLTLAIVNFIIVSIQIIISILFAIYLRLYFKKSLIVYAFFYLTIMAMISINNVFITLPLTIKILGTGGQGYYITYGWQLWTGRIILLLLSYTAFRFSTNRLIKEWKNV